MSGDIETCLRELFRSVLLQVMRETGLPTNAVSPSRGYDDLSRRILLRGSEAAKLLAISPRTLHELTRTGALKCVRVGRAVRYSPKILEEWVRKSQAKDSQTEQRNTDSHGSMTRRSKPVRAATQLTSGKRQKLKETRVQEATPSKPSKQEGKKVEENAQTRLQELRSFYARKLNIEITEWPKLTHGELMRIAGVDVPTLHSWMYRDREMPPEAIEKLRLFFPVVQEGNKINPIQSI